MTPAVFLTDPPERAGQPLNRSIAPLLHGTPLRQRDGCDASCRGTDFRSLPPRAVAAAAGVPAPTDQRGGGSAVDFPVARYVEVCAPACAACRSVLLSGLAVAFFGAKMRATLNWKT